MRGEPSTPVTARPRWAAFDGDLARADAQLDDRAGAGLQILLDVEAGVAAG
ncbi:MAG: hypothetical protein KIT58_00275 [Planctomycetota bacterium]|nr:hypothetical protein [Planctomycetota bacterium]